MFDPLLPQEGTPADAVQMRSQFNGLKALIDAISTVTAAQVDAVNTVPPGQPAAVNVSVNGGTLHFTFDLPQGNEGAQGAEGQPGSDGGQGQPFAQAVVDGVTTLAPGSPATVATSFDGTDVHFTFGIPQGVAGATGPAGSVNSAQLNAATAATLTSALQQSSNNSDSVPELNLTLSVNYNPGDLQTLINKVNELITNLRRGV